MPPPPPLRIGDPGEMVEQFYEEKGKKFSFVGSKCQLHIMSFAGDFFKYKFNMYSLNFIVLYVIVLKG